MFGSAILDVAIGLFMIYLILSLVCTAINEAIATLTDQRGKHLQEGVKNLLNDPDLTGLAKQIYSHGLIDGLSRNAANPAKKNRPPSYMPAGTFSLALFDVLTAHGAIANAPASAGALGSAIVDSATKAANAAQKDPDNPTLGSAASLTLERQLALGRELAVAAPDIMANVKTAIAQLPPGHTQEALFVLLDKSAREVSATVSHIEAFQKNVEGWFNDAMDRVSGWYKRWTQVCLAVVALVVVVAANADTLKIVQRLEADTALRASLAAAAQDVAKQTSADSEGVKTAVAKAESLALPIGWNAWPWDASHSALAITMKLLGLLITVLATSFGAPFWFDALGKVANLRGSGAPVTTKPEPQKVTT